MPQKLVAEYNKVMTKSANRKDKSIEVTFIHTMPKQGLGNTKKAGLKQSDGSFIKSHLQGVNEMTPDILDYYTIGELEVELSKGMDALGDTVYGVTVVDTKTGSLHEASKLCRSPKQAEAHLEQLANEYNQRANRAIIE
jgi:hypothetical protein